MFISKHRFSESLTIVSYNHSTGSVIVKNTDPTFGLEPDVQVYPLAQFLREIGIPFKAVRAITSGESTEPAVA